MIYKRFVGSLNDITRKFKRVREKERGGLA